MIPSLYSEIQNIPKFCIYNYDKKLSLIAPVDSNDKTELTNSAITSVQNACSALTGMLQNCQDSKLREAAMKFSARLTKLSGSSLMNGKLAAALFDFGQSELLKAKMVRLKYSQTGNKSWEMAAVKQFPKDEQWQYMHLKFRGKKQSKVMTWHAVLLKTGIVQRMRALVLCDLRQGMFQNTIGV